MGLLQAAYRTYEAHKELAGRVEVGKEPLTPVSHIMQNAAIEITLDAQGQFQSAQKVAKTDMKTIIPATLNSAGRTVKAVAHPLSDQLQYLAPFGEEKLEDYLTGLRAWVSSDYAHPSLVAVLRYIEGGSIINDLIQAGIITLEADKVKGSKHEKDMIRWRVIRADHYVSACWEDTSLFESFQNYYDWMRSQDEKDLCMITGKEDFVCEMHPKGTVSSSYGAKLLSSNDEKGFTYRGRFATGREAYHVGYTASQKAHNALHWIAANQGVIFGGRTFLCWNPEGKPVPIIGDFGFASEEALDVVSYKKQLFETLSGYRNTLADTDDVIIASLDAATTGRLSITYYNELKASDFLERIRQWYEICCCDTYWGVQSPSIKQIATCTCGSQRGNFIEADERVLRDYAQRLFHCIIDLQAIPQDIVQALVNKAGNLQIYKPKNRQTLLATTCSIIRKDKYDRFKEEWNLALDYSNTDRSYLFGRLLAVMEQVERSTYQNGEERDTNALRMQSVFAQRPMYAWRIIEEKLNPYFARMSSGLRNYYKSMIAEIADKLPDAGSAELEKKLSDTYLLGYYHQRNAFYKKNSNTSKEETNHELSE